MRSADKIAPQNEKQRDDERRVADLPRKLGARRHRDDHAHPVWKLAAQIRRVHADERHADRPFERKHEQQHQRQVHDHGVELFYRLQPKHGVKQNLKRQKYRAHKRDQPLLARCFAAAGDFRAEKSSENKNAAIVYGAENPKHHRSALPLLEQQRHIILLKLWV